MIEKEIVFQAIKKNENKYQNKKKKEKNITCIDISRNQRTQEKADQKLHLYLV